MSKLITLNINEMFETIQGEGAHTGIPSIFVRLQGCPVGCPWCDTKHTWTLDNALVTTAQQVIDKTNESEHFLKSMKTSCCRCFLNKVMWQSMWLSPVVSHACMICARLPHCYMTTAFPRK